MPRRSARGRLAVRSGIAPSSRSRLTSQSTNAPTASGSDASIATRRDVAALPVGPRHRQRDDRRLRSAARPRTGASGDVVGLQRWRVAGHHRRERGVDARAGSRARCGSSSSGARVWRPRVSSSSRDVAVDADVGAAEAVDRLLRVADDEEASRRPGVHGAPVRWPVASAVAEQQEDLGLQRIGVLELVHEDVREPLLERPRRTLGVVAHAGRARGAAGRGSRARRPALERFVALDARRAAPRCSSAARSASASSSELRRGRCTQRVARVDDARARDALPVPGAAARACAFEQLAIARQIDEPRLPAVVVAIGRTTASSAISWLRLPRRRRVENSGSPRRRTAGRSASANACRWSTRRSISPLAIERGARPRRARSRATRPAPTPARRSRSIGAVRAVAPSARSHGTADRRSARRTPSGGSSSCSCSQPPNASSKSRSAWPR